MDIKSIKELLKLMNDNDLVEIEVEAGDNKIKLKKAGAAAINPIITHVPAHHGAPASAAAPSAPPAADEFANCKQIISPIPGTVYLRPNPDAQNFVALGTQIDEGKVVCLIEAMKVFNEIKSDAGIKGAIKKVCVEDGQAVEYGTVLFLVG